MLLNCFSWLRKLSWKKTLVPSEPTDLSGVYFHIPPKQTDPFATSPSFDLTTQRTWSADVRWGNSWCTISYTGFPLAKENLSKRSYRLSPTIRSVIERDDDTQHRGRLAILPTELLLLIIEALPTHARATLALTNTSFMRPLGRSCWESLLNFTDTAENLGYLSALEKDLRNLLACSHCLALQPRRDFRLVRKHGENQATQMCNVFYKRAWATHHDLVQKQRGNLTGRTCNVVYGKVHLGYDLHFSWTDMEEFPRNSSRTEFATIYMDKVRRTYVHFHRSGYVHVVFNLCKVGSVLCAITRWEVPEATDLVSNKDHTTIANHLDWIPAWLCPHNSWQETWVAKFCNGSVERDEEADQWSPSMRCTYCSTDFTSAIEPRADGKRCLVLTTWKILGDDRLPESREWMFQCQVVRDDYTGFSCRGRSLREGGTIRAALVGYLKRGKGLDLSGLWVEEDNLEPPDILGRHVKFRETDRLRRHRRGIADEAEIIL